MPLTPDPKPTPAPPAPSVVLTADQQQKVAAVKKARADRRAAAKTAAAPRVQHATDLRTKLLAAMNANQTYIGLSSPTAAQTTAEVKLLARQVNALIRLQLGKLDSTDGT